MKVVVYGLDACIYCKLILHSLKKANLTWESSDASLDEFHQLYPGKEYPSVIIDNKFIGGAPALIHYLTEENLL